MKKTLFMLALMPLVQAEPLSVSASSTIAQCDIGNGSTVNIEITGGIGPFEVTFNEQTLQATGQGVFTFYEVAPGQHELTVTDLSSPLEKVSMPFVVEESDLTLATTVAPREVSVSVSGGVSPYVVTVGQESQIGDGSEFLFTDLQAAEYPVEVIDAQGCKRSLSVVVLDSED